MLKVTHQSQNGFLGGPKYVNLSVVMNNATFDICIKQLGIREITIETEDGAYSDLFSVFDALETLLMLFDGQFYPVIVASDKGSDITHNFNMKRLASYTSADFMIGPESKLIEFDSVLDQTLLQKWLQIRSELDLIHKMVLYCLSAVEMPKDIQCAFMVEAVKGLCKIIHVHDKSFAPALFTGKEPSLKMTFLAVADQYGSDIFADEFARNKEGFASILVNTRNRIAHINDNERMQILPRVVNVWYIIKLSLLYRIALFELLDVPRSVYSDPLGKYIQALNMRPGMDDFIKNIPIDQPAQIDPDLKMDIYSLLYSFVYSVAVFKVMDTRKAHFQTMEVEQARFWTSVSDNSIQQAVVNWCKVFGSYNERTHYSKINTEHVKAFEKAVVERNIDFADYSKSMKNFRDKFIAHLDKKKERKEIPFLDSALTICFLYEEMVICGDAGVFPFDLRQFYTKSQREINQYFDVQGILK